MIIKTDAEMAIIRTDFCNQHWNASAGIHSVGIGFDSAGNSALRVGVIDQTALQKLPSNFGGVPIVGHISRRPRLL